MGKDNDRMMPSNRYELSYLLGRVNLPSLPEAVIKLNQSMERDAPLDEIVDIINIEPPLAARVLHLANSAWYRTEQPITSVKEAVSNIGFSSIHRLIIITSVIDIFQGIDSTLLNMQTYWRQSARMGCAARILAEETGSDHEMRVFTSGVLGYIGKLVLCIGLPGVEQKALLVSKDEAIPQYRAEQQIIGHDHAEVGSELLRKWYVPEAIADPIRYLYDPQKAPSEYRMDAALLNIAHHMQYTFWHDIALTDPPSPPPEESMTSLGVSEGMLPALSRKVDEEYRRTLSLLDLK
jgi:HD-like signal output (HDOD) protein